MTVANDADTLRAAPARRGWTGFLAAASIALCAFLAGAPTPTAAQDQGGDLGVRNDGLIRPNQMDGGALLFFTDEPGLFVPAPLISTDIDVSVAGPIARTVVTQRFRNPADVFVEGRYQFPLPEGSAVDTLKMRIGDRLIEGDVKEREEAKQIYETAKAEGFKASLVEQLRPNIFTTSVANIGPNEVVIVQIEYQETLAPRDGVFGLRVPLVVAPRYTPPELVELVVLGPDGWEVETPTQLQGAFLGRSTESDVDAPIADPRALDPGEILNPVELTVDIEAGFPIADVTSLYHEVDTVMRGDESGASVALQGPVPADRDFFLSWAPQDVDAPYVALFGEAEPAEDGVEHYVFMITPPAPEASQTEPKPRDVIFVQDISGSMFGESIEQARQGLQMAIQRLRPTDRFNIIVFNDQYGVYADALVDATPENIAQAVEVVGALEADGGTEMLPALAEALKDPTPEDANRLRQVVFLTDGAVSNEADMLRLIETDLGRSRLFTVGIGSAPNSYFMTAAAEAGRGAFVFIGDLAEVQSRMEALFRRIENPAMTDMTLEVVGREGVEIWPNPLPDLYAGDPVFATVRVPEGEPEARDLRIAGVRGDAAWEQTVALASADPRPGVSKLWARQRIRALEAFRLSPEVDFDMQDEIDAEILRTALTHHLVSRLTSLVAVDVTPTRPVDEGVVSTEAPLNLPAGWDAAKFFDPPAPSEPVDAAAPIPTAIPAAAEARLVEAAEIRSRSIAAGAQIPGTSADWLIRVLLGAVLLLLAGLVWRAGRRLGPA